jgi:nitrile hydratase accessory protein
VSADLTTRPTPTASQHFPRDDDGSVFREPVFREPVFREPWEAQAFALAQSLKERGVFSASEWSAALGAEIRKAQAAGDPDTGATYYRHWLAALEGLIAAKGLADAPMLTRNREAWRRASARTPHGEPIALQPGDFGE